MISVLCFFNIATSQHLRLVNCGISGFAKDFIDSFQHDRICLELDSTITRIAAG
jgi:hypothetical protein